jgi:hypothetical protein
MKRIYALLDPNTAVVKYIGATSNTISNRITQHIEKAKKYQHIKGKHSWLMELREGGQRPSFIILKELCEDWVEQEKHFIKMHNNTIFNITEGGENEHFNKGREPWNKGGGKYTPETIEKFRQAKLGVVQSEQQKNNSRLAAIGKSKSNSHRLNLRTKKGTKPILKFDLEDNFIEEFHAASFAAQSISDLEYGKELIYLGRKINYACHKSKPFMDYKWKFRTT